MKIRQSQDEVETAMANYIQHAVLTPSLIERAIAEIVEEVRRELAAPTVDLADLEKELRQLNREQDAVAQGIALAPNIPSLVAELQKRQDRISVLEAELVAAKRTPKMLADLMVKVETSARRKLENMRTTLAADPSGAREVYKALFPEGLIFKPTQKGTRRVWEIHGIARLGGCTLESDPTGTCEQSWTEPVPAYLCNYRDLLLRKRKVS